MILRDAQNDLLSKAEGENWPVSRWTRPIHAGIVGAGYIADFHAYALRQMSGVELTGVCDANLSRAESFANNWGISRRFDCLQSMLLAQQLDVIHILAPPDQHYALTKLALQSGVSVFLEKPMCTSVKEADELIALAREHGLYFGVSHNFLFSGAYQRLRDVVRSGGLGPLDYVTINHFFELAQIRSGPFDSWMLRAPGNAILEVGPHVVSAFLDLVGPSEKLVCTAEQRIQLPGGSYTFRRWRVRGTAQQTAVDINIELGPGFSQRTISARGLLGTAMADLDANVCVIDRAGTLSIDLDRYRRSWSLSGQLKSQAKKTFVAYALSKIGIRHRGNPYQTTILDSVAAFYKGLRSGAPLDQRIDAIRGRDVIECCTTIIRQAGMLSEAPPVSRPQRKSSVRPTVLVFGGTGFIGRELVRQLLACGFCVRAAVHSSGAVLEALDNGSLEIIRVNMEAEENIRAAMDGIEFVYHLARANAKTWKEYLLHDLEPTKLIAKASLASKIKRLIYTGTIDSYYAGARAGTITENTGLDRNIARRNYYARAKASAEEFLTGMHRTEGLPVVIFRPGIVVGKGGTPFHWGVGLWPAPGVCQVWGDGTVKLPLVLVSDVATALVHGIQVPGIEGRSYNLVDIPLLTAREYLTELQRLGKMTLDVRYRPILAFYVTDLGKWIVKLAIRHPDRYRIPSYFDWESRSQRAQFNCERARVDLAWEPTSDRQRMIDDGIGASLRGWLGHP